MRDNEIRNYISIDREMAQFKREQGIKCKHGISDDKIRMIRRAQKRDYMLDEHGFTLVHGDIDREVYKRFYPKRWFTREEQECLEDDIWVHMRYQAYDCTGQRFTKYVQFFPMPHGTWVYHTLGYDY